MLMCVSMWLTVMPVSEQKSRTQQSPGLLQSLPIPAYPWQHVTMDFVTG